MMTFDFEHTGYSLQVSKPHGGSTIVVECRNGQQLDRTIREWMITGLLKIHDTVQVLPIMRARQKRQET